MSAEYRTVNPNRLALPLQLGCKDLASLLYTHLLLGPLSGRFPGLVCHGPMAMAEAMSREDDIAVVRAALIELVAVGLAEYDPAAKVVRLVGVLEDHARQVKSADTVRGWVREACSAPRSPVVNAHLQELLALRPGADAREGWAELERELGARVQAPGGVPRGGLGPARATQIKPPRPPRGGVRGPPQGALPLTADPPPTSSRSLGGTPEGASELDPPPPVKDQDQDQDQDPEQDQEQDPGAPAGLSASERALVAPKAERILATLAEHPHPAGKKPLRNTASNRQYLEELLAGGELAEEVLYVSGRYLQILTRRELVPQRKGPPRVEDPTWYDRFVWRHSRWGVVRSIVEAADYAASERQAAEQEAALAAAAAGRERDRVAEVQARMAAESEALQAVLASNDAFASISDALSHSNSAFARSIVHHQQAAKAIETSP